MERPWPRKVPTEYVHKNTRGAEARHGKTINALTRRTAQLAAANESLRREIARRRIVEKSLRASEVHTSLLLSKSQQMQQELRELSRRLLSVQEEERKRISRELHDVVAQALSGISVQLTLLKKRSVAGTKDLQRRLAAAQMHVRDASDVVHRFARDLRPSVLDDLGLLPAIRSHLKFIAAETGLQTKLTGLSRIEDLGQQERTALYRIFHQALANIAEHAGATRVAVRITQRAGALRMVVEDDGRGFKPSRAAKEDGTPHLGILGMRERAEMVGGTFSVASAPGKSTRIEVVLPPKSPAAKDQGARA